MGTVINLEPSLLVYLAVPFVEGETGGACGATVGC